MSDRVDAYVNFAWRVGTLTRKVDPNYYVKLDCNGNEEHYAFYKIRLHLEWKNGSWFYPRNGYVTFFFLCFLDLLVFISDFCFSLSGNFVEVFWLLFLLINCFLIKH